MEPDKYVERLRELSGKKHVLLKDMLELTRAQSLTINEDGIENLQKLINDKQAIISKINMIDEEFEVYFTRLKQQLKVKNLDEVKEPGIAGIKELKQTIGQIMSTMQEIGRIEKENNDKVKKLMDAFTEEIKKLNLGKKINTAYNPGTLMKPPSYFVDQKK